MGWDEAVTAAEIESTLAWWRDAGVDTVVDEAPRAWLTTGTALPIAPDRVVAPASTIKPPDKLPQTLAAFIEYMMTAADVPGGGPVRRRVGPSGDPAAGLMILTDMPDAADVEAGTLLSGEIAELFDKMIAAIGRTRSSVYVTSMVPARTPTGRIDPALLAAVIDVARHHVRMAAPKQLWLLGDTASRAILGLSEPQANGQLHRVNLDGVMIDAIATAHPKLLLRDPERKHRRRMWAEMQRLKSEETT